MTGAVPFDPLNLRKVSTEPEATTDGSNRVLDVLGFNKVLNQVPGLTPSGNVDAPGALTGTQALVGGGGKAQVTYTAGLSRIAEAREASSDYRDWNLAFTAVNA